MLTKIALAAAIALASFSAVSANYYAVTPLKRAVATVPDTGPGSPETPEEVAVSMELASVQIPDRAAGYAGAASFNFAPLLTVTAMRRTSLPTSPGGFLPASCQR